MAKEDSLEGRIKNKKTFEKMFPRNMSISAAKLGTCNRRLWVMITCALEEVQAVCGWLSLEAVCKEFQYLHISILKDYLQPVSRKVRYH